MGFALAGAATGAAQSLQDLLAIAYQQSQDRQAQANKEKADAESTRRFNIEDADRKHQIAQGDENQQFNRASEMLKLQDGRPGADLGVGPMSTGALSPAEQADPNFMRIPQTAPKPVDFGGGFQVRPRTAEEMSSAAQAADENKIRDVAPGASLVRGNQPIYTNPKEPAAPTEADLDAKYQAIETKRALGQPLTPEESATKKAFESRKTLGAVTNFNLNQPGKDDSRRIASMNKTDNILQGERKPAAEKLEQWNVLNDALTENTPESLKLVAPELLKLEVAGGGLRITKEEIGQVTGGASKWEQLKAALNQWSLDPRQALSLTPEQTSEIRALASHVKNRAQQRVDLIDKASQDLLDAPSAEDHAKILLQTRKALTDVGRTQQPSGVQSTAPAGTTHMQKPDGTEVYLPNAQVQAAIAAGGKVIK